MAKKLIKIVNTRVIQNLKGCTDKILTKYLRWNMTIGYMLGKLKEMGFDSREDFIKFNFHLLSDNERKLAALVGLTKPEKDG